MYTYRRNGRLIIDIDEDALVHGISYLDKRLVITDRERYLNFLAKMITNFGDDGDFNSSSHFTKLIDKLVLEAVEYDQGIEINE